MHTLLLATIIAALTVGSAGNTSSTANPSASQLLKRVAQTYASCKSYRDTGTVTTVSRASGKTYRSALRFQTVFTRPDRFRFEYNIGKDSYTGPVRDIVWMSRGKAYRWWTVEPKVTREDSLGMAIAGATGVSAGSAHTVPRLLMLGKVGGWAVTDLQNPKLLGSESAGGADCYKIEGGGPRCGRATSESRVTIWIGERDYLIRKILHQFKVHEMAQTTVYKPELDISLPASAFDSGVKK